MTSIKQIEANRRNSLKSTGPKTEAGKRAARCNAVRHGLMAETVIGALEDAEDYKGFEAAITADYDAQSAVERELVLRLASLLWRLRRANPVLPPVADRSTLSSHVVSCGSAICPTMPSTASVATKLSFGAKPGRFCLRSTIWIAANRRREGGVSVLVVNNHSQPSGATSVEASIASRPSLQRSKDHVSDHVPRHRRVNDSLRASLVPSLLLWQN
jgi:hypothetical protein